MLKFISRSNHRRRPRIFSSLYLYNDVFVLYTSLTSNNLASFFLTADSLPYRIHCLPPLVTVRFFLGSFATSCLPKFLEDVGKSSDRITSSDDDTAWYDREDIGDIDEASNMSEHSDTENGAQVHVDLLPRRKYTGVAVHEDCDRDLHGRLGNRYPFDIWCYLAKHIKPEQIQTFACLCWGANEAVNSVSFWIRLYQNFVADLMALPDRLKPDWIESRAGLKMRVVRALFIGYGNLKNLLLRETLEVTRNTQTLSKLVGLRCCQTWYKPLSAGKPNSSYTFYFKFNCELEEMVTMCALDDESDYLTWNYERKFVVLQLTVSNFVFFESVCGKTLTNISVHLGRNMSYHCVKMIFHSYRRDGRYRKNDGTMTVLDPVCELRVLRWWHPFYPHCDE